MAVIIVSVILAIILMILAFNYVAGFILLLLIKVDVNILSLSTLYSYYKYYNADVLVMKKFEVACYAGALVALIVPVMFFFILKKPKRELYGHSKMASKAEAIKALSAPKGILCGQIGNKYLSFGGTQHALMEAPSRSGKGVGFVIPNCLNFYGSIAVLDIKGENYSITSEYRRKHGNEVYFFNPAPNGIYNEKTKAREYHTHRWNFLACVSNDPNERVNDIQKIASQLFPDGDSGNSGNLFFQQQARSLFLALVLYLFDTDDLPVTPGEVYRQSLKLANKDYFKKECETRLEKIKDDPRTKLISPIAERTFNSFSALSDNTSSSVMGTITAVLELWANPIIDSATSANDFDLSAIRKKKMSIYFVVTPDNIARFAFLVNIFFQQIFDLNLRELPEHNPELKYPCLFLLDEFTAIGKIETIAKGIAYFAGCNLRLAIIIQSVAQLTAVYGEAVKDTFVTNLALRIIFAPKENKVAEEIEKSLGYITEKSYSKSKSKNMGKASNSESVSAVKRAVLWAHELKEIGQDKQIVLVDNVPPILCKKIVYYKDKNFKSRLLGSAIVPELEVLKIKNDNLTENIIVVETAEQVDKINIENLVQNYDYSSLDLNDFIAEDNNTEDISKLIAYSALESLNTEFTDEDKSIINKLKSQYSNV